jgi:hypothetical protein
VHIEVVVTCVDYSDFLEITLPVTVRVFDAVTIVTSPTDYRTIAIATRHRCRIKKTATWKTNGARFNKAAALNECIQDIEIAMRDAWILSLDADILLREDFSLRRCPFAKSDLYSIRRRTCEIEKDWINHKAGDIPWCAFPLQLPPIINGMAWGHRPTMNVAGLCGYFQLWNLGNPYVNRFPESMNAATYDVLFGMSFPEERRHFLPGLEALHLGRQRRNWDGRISEQWLNSSDGDNR